MPRYGRSGNFRGYVGACVDITDLLKKEEALHESEERVALAAEAAQIGVWELDPATKELWVSEKWRGLFGFGQEEEVSYEEFRSARASGRTGQSAMPSSRRRSRTKGAYDTEFRVVLAGRNSALDGGAGALPDPCRWRASAASWASR